MDDWGGGAVALLEWVEGRVDVVLEKIGVFVAAGHRLVEGARRIQGGALHSVRR